MRLKDRDQAKVADPLFARRYVDGFAFVKVPRFRHDAESWTTFTNSFLERIVFTARHQRRRSNLIVRCCVETGILDENTTPETLLGRLRDPKDWKRVREHIVLETNDAMKEI